MILPECFWIHYRELAERIRQDYARAVNLSEEEGVHDLRVDIKRLRAYINVIEYINPVFQIQNTFKPIRRLFKSAGPLRDLQVQLKLLREISRTSQYEISEYFNTIKLHETHTRKAFIRKARNFKFNILKTGWAEIRQALIFISAEYIQYKAEARFQGLVDDVIAFKDRQDFREEDYHSIRIRAKEARYALEIISRCYPHNEHWEELNRSLRTLHQALGKWHDSDIGLQRLEGFLLRQSGKPMYSPESYSRLIRMLQVEKENQLHCFEEGWRRFIEGLDRRGSPGKEDRNVEKPVQNRGGGKDSEGT